MKSKTIDTRLLDFGSLRQQEICKAINAAGSIRGGARALNVDYKTVQNAIASLKRIAARAGYSPAHDLTHPAPDGFHLKGASTLYKKHADGSKREVLQWVKTNKDREYRHEIFVEACQRLAEPFRAKSVLAPVPTKFDASCLTVYPMGDPHAGLMAWAKECGEDFDLPIWERQLVGAVDKLVELAPPTKHALVVELGDFFHTDNSQNRTMRSGAPLDVDTRWPKILGVGIRAMRRVVDRAKTKHEFVDVIIEIGNHDDHSAIMLAVVLAQYYENDPRVRVDISPALFHYYRFGKCLIGVTHGDKAKPENLPGIMAVDRAKDWGETLHRYWYCGHIHHDRLKEFAGCTVESFRTLAARDAWHAGQGYRSGRDMKCLVLHEEHGEIMRHVVGLSRIAA